MTALALIDADPYWADVPTGNAPPDPVDALVDRIEKLGGYQTLAKAWALSVELRGGIETLADLRREVEHARVWLESLLDVPIYEVAKARSWPEAPDVNETAEMASEPLEWALRKVLVVKTCHGCGTRYTAETWDALEFVSRRDGIEQRNCYCDSRGMTLAVEEE